MDFRYWKYDYKSGPQPVNPISSRIYVLIVLFMEHSNVAYRYEGRR